MGLGCPSTHWKAAGADGLLIGRVICITLSKLVLGVLSTWRQLEGCDSSTSRPGGRGPLDEPLVTNPPYTAYTQFVGLTQHDLYYAGQIVLLKRLC